MKKILTTIAISFIMLSCGKKNITNPDISGFKNFVLNQVDEGRKGFKPIILKDNVNLFLAIISINDRKEENKNIDMKELSKQVIDLSKVIDQKAKWEFLKDKKELRITYDKYMVIFEADIIGDKYIVYYNKEPKVINITTGKQVIFGSSN